MGSKTASAILDNAVEVIVAVKTVEAIAVVVVDAVGTEIRATTTDTRTSHHKYSNHIRVIIPLHFRKECQEIIRVTCHLVTARINPNHEILIVTG